MNNVVFLYLCAHNCLPFIETFHIAATSLLGSCFPTCYGNYPYVGVNALANLMLLPCIQFLNQAYDHFQ